MRDYVGRKTCRKEEVVKRAQKNHEDGKSASTQAGGFVREEIHHIREGKHGARSAQQAIAIGLSKARRAGVKLPPPKIGKTSSRTRAQAKRDVRKAQNSRGSRPSRTRSRAILSALKREGHSSASHGSLARQAHRSALSRGSGSRHRAAIRALRACGKLLAKRPVRAQDTAGQRDLIAKAARKRKNIRKASN